MNLYSLPLPPFPPLPLPQAIQHTLHNPNSAQYRRLMEKLFSQENSKLVEMAYFSEHFSIELEKVREGEREDSY